jgi:hypothetical protein
MALNLLDKPNKTKNKISIEYAIQLAVTLFIMYIVNKIGIDIWRAIKGH